MISPSVVKSKYLNCLEKKFLNFYPSRKVFIKISEGFAPFEVRYCPALVAKKAEVSVERKEASQETKLSRNPFLPFDQNLLVSNLNSPNYALIFNKFCVVPEHLLIITREFVDQTAEFCNDDFRIVESVLESLRETNPLAFYNSGVDAGASQAHRHFQVIPTETVPIDAHIKSTTCFDEPFRIPLYSTFIHACIRRPDSMNSSDWHFEACKKLKSFCSKDSTAFNLIWTRDWILLVPRRKEFTDDNLNSLNAMAFAGYFLVMDEGHMHQFNVVKVLEQVTFPYPQ